MCYGTRRFLAVFLIEVEMSSCHIKPSLNVLVPFNFIFNSQRYKTLLPIRHNIFIINFFGEKYH